MISWLIESYSYNGCCFIEKDSRVLINNFIFDERNLNIKKKFNFP